MENIKDQYILSPRLDFTIFFFIFSLYSRRFLIFSKYYIRRESKKKIIIIEKTFFFSTKIRDHHHHHRSIIKIVFVLSPVYRECNTKQNVQKFKLFSKQNKKIRNLISHEVIREVARLAHVICKLNSVCYVQEMYVYSRA